MGEKQRRLVKAWYDAERLRCGCAICGYDKCPSAIHLHHINSQDKESVHSYKSFPQLFRALSKCVMFCANCHAEIHSGLHPQFIITEEVESDLHEQIELFAFNINRINYTIFCSYALEIFMVICVFKTNLNSVMVNVTN